MNSNRPKILATITIYICAILFSSITYAQVNVQMVVSFKETGDPVDFTDFPDFSAVYITSDIPDLVVTSGVSLIFRTVIGSNKELLIVTPTEQTMEFNSNGYNSVTIEIPPLRPRQIVWLHVEQFIPQPILGEISLTTRPAGANVVVSGKESTFKTPAKIDKLIAGIYNVSVSLKDYETYNVQVALSEGETKAFDITLKPMYGSILVASNPSNASFRLSGNTKISTTPGVIENLTTGVYNLIVTLEGYETDERQIRVTAGQELFVDVSLVKKPEVIVNPPTIVRQVEQTPKESGKMGGTKEMDDPAKMIRKPKKGATIAYSVFIPGAGQIYSKRGIGWLWATAGIGSATFSVLSYLELETKTYDYNVAYANYKNATSVVLAQKYRNESEVKFVAMTKAHDKMIIGIGAFASVYIIQLVDAAIAKPKAFNMADKMSLQLKKGGTISFNYRLN